MTTLFNYIELKEVVITCENEVSKAKLTKYFDSFSQEDILIVIKGNFLHIPDVLSDSRAFVTHAEPVLKGRIVQTTSVIIIIDESHKLLPASSSSTLLSKSNIELINYLGVVFIRNFAFRRFFADWTQILKEYRLQSSCDSMLSLNAAYVSAFVYGKLLAAGCEGFVEIKVVGQNADRKLLKVNKLKTSTHQIQQRSNVILVNPTTWINLSDLQFNEDLTIEIVDNHPKVEFAKECKVAMIRCPNQQDDFEIGPELNKHFAEAHLLAKGDVFSIIKETTDGEIVRVWLKVVYIKGESEDLSKRVFLVDTNNSALYQLTVTQGYLPQENPFPSISEWSFFQRHSKVLVQIVRRCQRQKIQTRQSAVLLSGKRGIGKRLLARLVAYKTGIHLYEVDGYQLWSEAAGTSEKKILNAFQKARRLGPCLFLIRNVEVLGKNPTSGDNDLRIVHKFKDSLREGVDANWPFLVVATTTDMEVVPTELLACFDQTVEMKVPEESDRVEIVRLLLSSISCANVTQVDLTKIARRTSGFHLSDFEILMDEIKWQAYCRVTGTSRCSTSISTHQLELIARQSGFELLTTDIDSALKLILSKRSDTIGAPKIPEIHWEDVGGLTDVKNDIIDTIQLTIQYPQLFTEGLKRAGILLHGPPGCGKTLLAKAVATECQLSFFSVKGPELLNMYVGQSEKNIREVFERARMAAPCVIFFDELDSLAPNRGRSGDSGGVMDRVVSQLLAELDGLSSSGEVFVIGATNRPDLIDPALLRPGRFDKIVYVGIGETKEARLSVLKAASRKMKLGSDVSLAEIVDICPKNMSGADFYSLCASAVTNGIARMICQLESGTQDLRLTGTAEGVTIIKEDFLQSLLKDL